jgi:hypothetical protein
MAVDGTKACNRYRADRQNGLGAIVSITVWTMGREPQDLSGVDLSSLPGLTVKTGALHPEFPCWLMGFPKEWDAYAPMATPSSPNSRPK